MVLPLYSPQPVSSAAQNRLASSCLTYSLLTDSPPPPPSVTLSSAHNSFSPQKPMVFHT